LADMYERRFGGDIAAGELAAHRKVVDQTWAPPRMVAPAARGESAARLPAATLMQVEIAFYPDISCDSRAAREVPPNDPVRGAPIAPEELARLGVPINVQRIWILPAALDSPGTFLTGPAWIGNFLREAGAGGTVFFPAYQNCAMSGSETAELLPREVFFFGNMLRIGARQPFTARVLDACSADFVVRRETLRSHHIPFWRAGFGPAIGATVERTRTTAAVSAHCPAGDAVFTLGPIVSDSPSDDHGDPALSLVAKVPPGSSRKSP